MNAIRAHRLYEARCTTIRSTLSRSSREFAAAMSDACREYEASMRKAAAGGDFQAAECVAASEGPYLNP
jgi:hypothetical protein